MDWFERLTGFREAGYESTRQQLEVVGRQLRSRVNGQSYGIGEFEPVSLETLRQRVPLGRPLPGRLKVSVVQGDVRELHRSPEYCGALFQVASQFNMLEMVGPNLTPEDGVTRYEHDRTQGPACAISAGAATIFRNYFVPVGNQCGQTKTRQLNGLSDLAVALTKSLGIPVEALWSMRNGYALCTREGLDAISGLLTSLSSDETDMLRGKLRIGVHWDVEVTSAPGANRPSVSQAFCSALPISYSSVPHRHWPAFASLVLEAAYEATMWAGVHNAQRGVSNIVLLTRLGGGAFGNDDQWIDAAMRRALQRATTFNLDVTIVSYGPPSHAVLQIAEEFR
jgi:hypothetical protein